LKPLILISLFCGPPITRQKLRELWDAYDSEINQVARKAFNQTINDIENNIAWVAKYSDDIVNSLQAAVEADGECSSSGKRAAKKATLIASKQN
jgi:hypothetical protein